MNGSGILLERTGIRNGSHGSFSGFASSDCPAPGTFEAIFRALDADCEPLIGRMQSRLLVIPLHDVRRRQTASDPSADEPSVTGGLWGRTLFEWLHIEMLFVPEPMRGRGVGAALVASAEREARTRGCRSVLVDTFSFQAAPFYRKLGFMLFGVLPDFPPGHERLYFRKHLDGREDAEFRTPAYPAG